MSSATKTSSLPLYVHSYESFGTQDGPGIRLVVFLQGCQFRCQYCHNPDTQPIFDPNSQTQLRLGQPTTIAEILAKLEQNRAYFSSPSKGGLTVSGGEPFLQAPALLELMTAAQAQGFHVALDTNGFHFNSQTQTLLDQADLILLDVKQIDEQKHLALTGQSNTNTLKTAAYREKTGRPFWLRYVLVPSLTDDPHDLEKWAQHFASYQNIERIEILPFHQLGANKYQQLGLNYPLADLQPPTPENKQRALKIFQSYFSPEKIVLK